MKNFIIKMGVVFACMAVAGCVTTVSPEAMKIKEADENMVKECEFLGDVRGSSGWGGPLGGDTGLDDAKMQIRNQAAARKATHVVWRDVSAGTSKTMTYVNARIYSCLNNASKNQ